MMMEEIRNVYYHDSWCSYKAEKECRLSLSAVTDPNSCTNHAVIISFDVLLIFICICLSTSQGSPQRSQHFTLLSKTFNTVLGLAYLGLGIWMIIYKLGITHSILPLHAWMVNLIHGVTWLLLCFASSLKKVDLLMVKCCLILTFLFTGFLCISSMRFAAIHKVQSIKLVLDVLSFPGAILFLLSAFVGGTHGSNLQNDGLYEQLIDNDANLSTTRSVTPFENAGFFSSMTFWWLNPLMKKGKQKILEDEDIPALREAERAKTCYLMYFEEVSKHKLTGSSDRPSLLSLILSCEWKGIVISGLFALVKVLMLAISPLLLKAFIEVAEGITVFQHEGYILTIALFLAKCLESLSERQWYFRTRLIGTRVRSLLFATIYQKQLRLPSAAKLHSPGEIVNYVVVDAQRIGEFPYWLHQIWSTVLLLGLALVVVYYAVGLATISALVAIILTIGASTPLTKLQHKYHTKLTAAQDRRLKAITESLSNMMVLKLYAWEIHFKNVVEFVRNEEFQWIRGTLLLRGYNLVVFWSSPIIVPAVTFWACYFLGIPLTASNVFTFLASLRIVQEQIRLIPDVAGAAIEAKVSYSCIVNFLETPELQNKSTMEKCCDFEANQAIFISCSEISWDTYSLSKTTLRNIVLAVKKGEKVVICGEVGSGKSTLLAAVLGEVPVINGTVQVHGKVAYVSQTAWIQTGTIQENILFGSSMDDARYQDVLEKCSLVKDLEMLPFGDLTEIGERGVNLSGGQKQRVQLARALYQDADVYLLDDPFSAVDAHTATNLFNEYIMRALSGKAVLLVTHQVDFLQAFDYILFLSAGKAVLAGSYAQLLASNQEFRDLVNAHRSTSTFDSGLEYGSNIRAVTAEGEIRKIHGKRERAAAGGQLINEEERERGNTGFRPYLQYLSQGKGFVFFSAAAALHLMFMVGQYVQSYLLAVEVENSHTSRVQLITVYTGIGFMLAALLLLRSFSIVLLGCGASQSIFSKLLDSLFRAPMSFYDSTPVGRILSRVSSDLSIIDTEIPFRLALALGSAMNAYSMFILLAILTWPALFVIIPLVYLSILLQGYYLASAKELMRINGTTKSMVASHLAESIVGATTIRAFGQEDQFLFKHLELIDRNASTYFHSISANEWLILRLEILCAIVVSSSALATTLIPLGSSAAGLIGMALSYGLSINVFLTFSVQLQCLVSNLIVSVERLEQYMHIPGEAPEVIENHRPDPSWPAVGKVEICNLKIKYHSNAPFILRGISCIIEGGYHVGIVGRTGSGKTTLIRALFRLVEPTDGKIIIDDMDTSTIGLQDLRSRLAIIPQDPTLFSGSVRYNLDPLSEHTDQEIWQALDKCQLQATIKEKLEGLDSVVVQDGLNWSVGQRQLFCLGRALLKRSRILVMDEATASIDNATDSVIQKNIQTEFAACTVITVAHRVPTVMGCTKVLAISDGQLVEYEEPLKLIKKEDSLFGQLYKEYWSHTPKANSHVQDMLV